jgi:histidinol dehydrogenase
VIRLIDLREQAADVAIVVPRAGLDVDTAIAQVRPIIEDVAERGAVAVIDWSEKLDGVRPQSLRVAQSAIDEALANLDSDVRAALVESIRRARIVHEDQRRTDVTTKVVDGGTVTERWLPVARSGLYVPGGRAVYPSSVVMNVVPAQVAGVESMVVVSPPQKDFGGLPHPTILAACGLLGITEVYAAGGAQAIAMLAYGVTLEDGSEVAPVNMVTGPGNIFVTAAKRMLKGRIGIDSEAGPTEIAILADSSARADLVAADLISQAEHDVIAASVLVTDSIALAEAVELELEKQVAKTKHAERIAHALDGRQSGIILVRDMEQGLDVINAYAAEHLEIQTVNSRELAMRVKNAGAIFVGNYSPVSLGDYCAGSNHVLPTGGCACHSSGLSVQTFLRGIHIVEYTEAALRDVAPHVLALSKAEDLPAHGEAVAIRFAGDANGGGQ